MKQPKSSGAPTRDGVQETESRRGAAYRVIARGIAGLKPSVQDAEDSELKLENDLIETQEARK